MKRSFKTQCGTDGSLYLSAAGRDSVFVSGVDADSVWSVTHYNLVTGERNSASRSYIT